MKKLVSLTLVAMMLLSTSACGGSNTNSKPERMSNEAYELGVRCLEIADGIIDGSILASNAEDDLETLYDNLSKLSSAADSYLDSLLEQYVMSLKYAVAYLAIQDNLLEAYDLIDDLAELTNNEKVDRTNDVAKREEDLQNVIEKRDALAGVLSK